MASYFRSGLFHQKLRSNFFFRLRKTSILFFDLCPDFSHLAFLFSGARLGQASHEMKNNFGTEINSYWSNDSKEYRCSWGLGPQTVKFTVRKRFDDFIDYFMSFRIFLKTTNKKKVGQQILEPFCSNCHFYRRTASLWIMIENRFRSFLRKMSAKSYFHGSIV